MRKFQDLKDFGIFMDLETCINEDCDSDEEHRMLLKIEKCSSIFILCSACKKKASIRRYSKLYWPNSWSVGMVLCSDDSLAPGQEWIAT